jgi:hypothetical protein
MELEWCRRTLNSQDFRTRAVEGCAEYVGGQEDGLEVGGRRGIIELNELGIDGPDIM